MEEAEKKKPIGRDIRRYYCEYCGIGRSKKALITSHILSHHKEEIEREKENNEKEEINSNTCEECGASFRKPAYLKQHMQSHSSEGLTFINECIELDTSTRSALQSLTLQKQNALADNKIYENEHLWSSRREALDPMYRTPKCEQRPYACAVDDCHSSYKRVDHLTRHLLQHQGKLFSCPVEGCNSRFAYQDNMKRHVTELHDETDSDSCDSSVQKQHVCPEVGCGKVFRFASRLRKHEESHVKLDSVEAVCCEPGCWKSFTNVECLKAHLQSSHLYINCEVCGTQQLKKNIKRHMRIHEAGYTSDRIKCSFKGCLHTFSTKSNLNQHIKAVHLELRPFVCRFDGCGEQFPYKHVRDNHEKSGTHVYIQGDFEEADAHFRSRPRGGKKRKYPTVEMLLRKRVVPPGQADSTSCEGSDYLAWLLSASDED